MADRKKVQEELRSMTDPIAYRDSGYDKYIEGWDGTKLQNADVNISQYGDDSSSKNYSNSALWGGENEKYTGENTKNSQVAYNPEATVEGLDPNYKYGQAAQMQNSIEANYIAKRNDEIASALYNAGKTSIQDVANYLSSQTGWEYSNESERQNTINSVWKRLGQIAAQNEQEEDVAKPERQVIDSKDTSGKIYGKATADSGDPLEGIDTLADANSIYTMLAAGRQANLDMLYNMSTDVIAASMANGIYPLGEQAVTDYQRAYPELWAEVQRKVKEIKGQDTINAITQGKTDYAEDDVSNTKTLSDTNKETVASTYTEDKKSTTEIINEINTELMSNQSASEASETMEKIEKEVAKLKNRLQNLRKEANEVFRGDAPDYLVNAYIANKTQDINNQLSILADRYSMASNRYDKEWDNKWKEKEYDLKERQVKNQEDQFEWNKYYQEYQMSRDNIVTDSNGKSWQYKLGEDGNWYYEEIPQRSRQYTIAERNNNPTNMTVDFLKIMGAEEGVDYEVSEDYFINSNGNKQYYGNLIGDPIERTISILDKAVANGMNPFTTTSWSYINKLGLTKDKWMGMTHSEKEDMIRKWLQYEGGDMSNMAYYIKGNKTNNNTDSDVDLSSIEVPDSIYREEVGENMDGSKIYREIDPNSEEGKKLADEYRQKYAQEHGMTGLKSRGSELVGEDGIDHAYEIISEDGVTPIAYRQVLYNLVPTKLKDNVKELENIYATAREMYLQNVPADEAAMLWYGINPITDDKTGMLSDIYYLARTAGATLDENFFGQLGTASRSGDPEAMVGFLENSILPEKAWEKENTYDFIIEQIQDLEAVLQSKDGKALIKATENWAPEGVTGFYRATLADIMNQYVKANPGFQEVASRIDGIVSSMISSMANSGNLTDKQIGLIEDYLPSEKDFLDSLDVKLQVAKENLLKEVNTTRKRYRLPELDESSISDMGLRAKLYTDAAQAKKQKNGYNQGSNVTPVLN